MIVAKIKANATRIGEDQSPNAKGYSKGSESRVDKESNDAETQGLRLHWKQERR
jgi:hypothetical protein